jgi:dTDP-4-dehydrorhamnose reductase
MQTVTAAVDETRGQDMDVLITGAAGLVGQALCKAAPAGIRVHARTHPELDVTDAAAVMAAIREVSATVVINAAAHRNPDRAEGAQDEEERARRVNTCGARILAEACSVSGAWLMHISTAHVFDGMRCTPYAPDDPMQPVNVYGVTKRDGDEAVRAVLPERSTIVRTSWLHAPHGRNFAMTMLDRAADSRVLRTVSDRFGAPTCSAGFATVVWALARIRVAGVFHWCDSGVASWYDFAVAVIEEAYAAGLLATMPEVVPVLSTAYDEVAPRPSNCVLDKEATEQCLGIRAPHWRAPLRAMIRGLVATRASGDLRSPRVGSNRN